MRAVIFAAVMSMMGNVRHTPTCTHHTRASAYSVAAERAIRLEKTDLEPSLVAAVAGKESSWTWTRGGKILTGKAGEVGFHQIHPTGRALALCTDLDVRRPVDNIRCGIRLLEEAQEVCGGSPLRWLGRYQGQPCGPSSYAEKVLALQARAGKLVAETP